MRKESNVVKGRAYYQGLRSKYLNFAKEASASGDRVASEYNLQFAEHYTRIIAERFPQQPQSNNSQPSAKVDSESSIQNDLEVESPAPKAQFAKKKTTKKEKTPEVELEEQSPQDV